VQAIRSALVVLAVCSCADPPPPAPTRSTPPPTSSSAPAPAPVAAVAAPTTLTGTWIGTYAYPDNPLVPPREPVRFFADLREQSSSVLGTILERNTFADASAKELRANVSGRRDPDGKVRFAKTYDGANGVTHTVEYEGTVDAALGRIEGTWRVGESSGRFEMTRWGSLTGR
jgi:hypothetical protein